MKEPAEIARREIQTRGPIPFARFMTLALYCPEFGYYERLENSIGRGGDFYTSVSTGPVFGELLAFQFARWLTETDPPSCQCLEAGAHDGRLAADLLGWWQARQPDLFKRMEYHILEPSAARRRLQRERLDSFRPHVRWFESWPSLPGAGVRGVIFSNELLDAMPAHRLGWNAATKTWFEWGVGLEDDRLVWTRIPTTPDAAPHLPSLPPALAAVLPDGFTTEVSPATLNWWRQAASALQQGRLLTFDYGLESEEFFSPGRAPGTLRAYHRHRWAADLLANPGRQDLTFHVNFTALQAEGEAAGLRTDAMISQERFLTRVAAAAAQSECGVDTLNPGRARQFQTLTHPDLLGTRFRVLIQSR